jgi:RNA polymerase sigma factor (sigma-70 family)
MNTIEQSISSRSDQESALLDREGNLSALAELARERKAHLFRFILRRVRDPVEAEEIMQQTFFEAVKGIQHFRADSKISTWLYGIASKLVSNYLCRSPRCIYRWVDDSVLEMDANYACDPQSAVAMRNLLDRLQHHLNSLSEEMRDTIFMVAVEEMSYAEAAASLGVPIGTVRSRISRIRSFLEERLEEEGAGYENALADCATYS